VSPPSRCPLAVRLSRLTDCRRSGSGWIPVDAPFRRRPARELPRSSFDMSTGTRPLSRGRSLSSRVRRSALSTHDARSSEEARTSRVRSRSAGAPREAKGRSLSLTPGASCHCLESPGRLDQRLEAVTVSSRLPRESSRRAARSHLRSARLRPLRRRPSPASALWVVPRLQGVAPRVSLVRSRAVAGALSPCPSMGFWFPFKVRRVFRGAPTVAGGSARAAEW